MPSKLTIEKVRARGLEKGFVLVSDAYTNCMEKQTWKCLKNGHIIQKRFNNISNGSGCKLCNTLNLEAIRESGFKQGWILLSNSYVPNTSLLWKCGQGHITSKRFDTLKSRCIVCCGKQKYSLHKIKEIVANYGFVYVLGNYKDNKSKLLVQCTLGHFDIKRFTDILRGRACYVCRPRREKAQKELYQSVLEKFPDALYNKKGLLKSPKFQLDVYIPSLKKAIELDGEYWHSRPDALERDARKDKECQEAGIQLLRLGYHAHWFNKQETIGKPKILEFLQTSLQSNLNNNG